MKRLLFAGTFFLAVIPLALSLPQNPKLPHPRDTVQAEAIVSSPQIVRGQEFEIAVVAKIRTGFHVNSNQPTEDHLIATEVIAKPPAGFRLVGTNYPPGEMQKFKFSPKSLSVYDGEVIMVLQFVAAADTPLGAAKIPLALRFHACTDEVCLPPVTKNLSAEFTVVLTASRTAAKPLVFKAEMKKTQKRK